MRLEPRLLFVVVGGDCGDQEDAGESAGRAQSVREGAAAGRAGEEEGEVEAGVAPDLRAGVRDLCHVSLHHPAAGDGDFKRHGLSEVLPQPCRYQYSK